jgi:hypothetical protein
MALPKINYPIFELILPSTKQNVKYRPFLVKEEKILLTAQISGEPQDIINSIKQVINNCIITEGVDVDKVTTFDLEYLFIKIRAKSVNNVITLAYKDLEDEKRYEVEVDLDQIEIKDAELFNGMLKVFLERIIPEYKKPKKIAVKEGGKKQLLTEERKNEITESFFPLSNFLPPQLL